MYNNILTPSSGKSSPPPLVRGISNTSTSSIMSSDDSELLYDDFGSNNSSPRQRPPHRRPQNLSVRSSGSNGINGNVTRSPSPNSRLRMRAAATPTIDNRGRNILPHKNSFSSTGGSSHQTMPQNNTTSAPTTTNKNNHINNNNNRKTKIQVCVRVRPILPSDHKKQSTATLSPDVRSGKKTVIKATSTRHMTIAATSPPSSSTPGSPRRRGRSHSPSGGGGGLNDTEPAWYVQNNTVSQSPHTNPDMTRTIDYTFDNSFGPTNSTHDIYQNTVKDIVTSTMEGYHASVFAYGQTATGKTYTMTGSNGVKNMNIHDDSTKGIVQLAIEDCFNYIYNQKTETREYLLRVSFMEIYNEVINDLLAAPVKTQPMMSTSMHASSPIPPMSSSNVRIFESKNEGVIIRGLKEEIVTDPEQVYALLAAGEKRRQTGSTILNKQSSRSHSIFRLIVESRRRIPRQSTSGNNFSDSSSVAESIASSTFAPETTAGPVRVSTLSLVDLAGSESVKNTGSTGARQKEGQYINKSLLTLGHVVYKLAENSSKGGKSVDAAHIPYRDSKLTRLLQPSLSGNAQICIICNISPLARHLEESHLTLKFASRAKKIKQNATITEVVDDRSLLENYREEIEELKRQLKEAREQQPTVSTSHDSNGIYDAEDAYVISEAILNLEKLILKTSTAEEKKRRKKRRERIAAQKKAQGQNGVIEIPEDVGLVMNQSLGSDALLNMLDDATDDGDDMLVSNLLPKQKVNKNKESDDNSIDESMSLGDESTIYEGKKLITELHRIRGLLGDVLERKSSVGNGSGVRSPKDTTPVKYNGGIGNNQNDEEVERLRAQLHEQAVTTSLRRADSTFLQSQLQEKDMLLKDVSQILEAVEHRQVELESENERLKQEYAKSIAALKSKESEVVILEKLMKKRESEIKRLKEKDEGS